MKTKYAIYCVLIALAALSTPASADMLASVYNDKLTECHDADEIYDTVLCQDLRAEDWSADTHDNNSDKDRGHACGDLCAGNCPGDVYHRTL